MQGIVLRSSAIIGATYIFGSGSSGDGNAKYTSHEGGNAGVREGITSSGSDGGNGLRGEEGGSSGVGGGIAEGNRVGDG